LSSTSSTVLPLAVMRFLARGAGLSPMEVVMSIRDKELAGLGSKMLFSSRLDLMPRPAKENSLDFDP
jgi:hypothetical protein